MARCMRVPSLSATNRYLRSIGRFAEYVELEGHRRFIVHRAGGDGFADYIDLLEFWNEEIQYAARVLTGSRQARAFIDRYWAATRRERNQIIVDMENWISGRDQAPIKSFLATCGSIRHEALPVGWRRELAESVNGWLNGRDFFQCACDAMKLVDPIVRLRWTHVDVMIEGPLSGVSIELRPSSYVASAPQQEQITMGISQVGANELKEKGPVRAAFRTVVEFLDKSPKVAALDEESITSFMFGAVAIICHELIERYGSGAVDRDQTCQLGPYKKSARSPKYDTEAASGADFALVLGEDADWVRMAIFQAKKGTSVKVDSSDKVDSNDWEIDVKRRSKKEERCAQVVALVKTGEHLAKGEEPGAETQAQTEARLKDLSSDDRAAILAQFSWIYYLGYREALPVCLSLDKLPVDAFEHELHKMRGQKFVSLNGHPAFFDVINAGLAMRPSSMVQNEVSAGTSSATKAGLDATPEVIDGWLRLPRKSMNKLLPALLDLMPIYVADDDGDGKWSPDAECSPETIEVAASEDAQLKTLKEDVAKLYSARSKTPRP